MLVAEVEVFVAGTQGLHAFTKSPGRDRVPAMQCSCQAHSSHLALAPNNVYVCACKVT